MEYGKVAIINISTGMFAVETDSGMTVCEMLDEPELKVGDVIAGDLEFPGVHTLINETRHFGFRAAVAEYHCSPDAARLATAR